MLIHNYLDCLLIYILNMCWFDRICSFIFFNTQSTHIKLLLQPPTGGHIPYNWVHINWFFLDEKLIDGTDDVVSNDGFKRRSS